MPEAYKHPSCNQLLQAEGCYDLPAERTEAELAGAQAPVLRTYWKLSEAEIEALQDGGEIRISLVGVTHPPIMFEVLDNEGNAT